jgi:hypothetical protein
MKTFSLTVFLAALVSITCAATVTLQTTECIRPTTILQFTIDTDKLVAKGHSSVFLLPLHKHSKIPTIRQRIPLIFGS